MAQATAGAAAVGTAQPGAGIPLVLDLDGTLSRTDPLLDSVFELAKEHPLLLFGLRVWPAQGRARLKQRVAAVSLPDVRTLPYHDALPRYLQARKDRHSLVVGAIVLAPFVAAA